VSVTRTVRVSEAVLFDESLTVYVIVYVPRTVVLTLLTVTMELVRLPSSLSNAVAPASVYGVPTSKVTNALPMSVMLGAVFV